MNWRKVCVILHYFNLSHHISRHIVGEKHTRKHRAAAGVGVGIIGVVIAHQSAYCVSPLNLLIDAIGYGLHGIGIYPFIEFLKPNEKG